MPSKDPTAGAQRPNNLAKMTQLMYLNLNRLGMLISPVVWRFYTIIYHNPEESIYVCLTFITAATPPRKGQAQAFRFNLSLRISFIHLPATIPYQAIRSIPSKLRSCVFKGVLRQQVLLFSRHRFLGQLDTSDHLILDYKTDVGIVGNAPSRQILSFC